MLKSTRARSCNRCQPAGAPHRTGYTISYFLRAACAPSLVQLIHVGCCRVRVRVDLCTLYHIYYTTQHALFQHNNVHARVLVAVISIHSARCAYYSYYMAPLAGSSKAFALPPCQHILTQQSRRARARAKNDRHAEEKGERADKIYAHTNTHTHSLTHKAWLLVPACLPAVLCDTQRAGALKRTPRNRGIPSVSTAPHSTNKTISACWCECVFM